MHWCLLLLIYVLSSLSSGTEIITKSFCRGDAVELFRNVAFINGSLVSIYINGESQTMIATGSSLSTFSILPEYKEKMFLDERGTFWIRQVQLSDGQKYVLRYQTDTRTTKDEVQIFVMDSPKRCCRPQILKVDSTLIASLEKDECGQPSASVKWLDYPGISYIDKSVLKLPAEKEPGTYYACAESPALKCVRDLEISDYCSSFVVEANNSPAVSSVSTQVSSEMFMIIGIFIFCLVILAVVITILVLQCKRRREEEAKSTQKGSRMMSYLSKCKEGNNYRARGNDVENVGEETEALLPSVETKSTELVEFTGQAAQTCRKFKKRPHLFVDDGKMEHPQGRIGGTGGVIMPVLMRFSTADTDY